MDKWPRWAMYSLISALILATGFFTNRAVADADNIKTVAYEARSNAQDALALGNDLKSQLVDVRISQEVFRKEYREDQKELDRKLGDIGRNIGEIVREVRK